MQTELTSSYKLVVLYVLNHTEQELTNSQLSEFVLTQPATNYFQLQQAISELVEGGLIEKRTAANSTYYKITPDGVNTIVCFEDDLSAELKLDVKEFLKSTGSNTRRAIQTPADYHLTQNGSYSVRCQILEKKLTLVDLNITVPSLEAAEAVCQNWPEKYQAIYDKIMEELL